MLFEIGYSFEDGFWNRLATSGTREGAEEAALEIKAEYGEMPEIRKVKSRRGKK